ncbi:MAG TPA: AmpG family muropeptide MFS transporter, partial [Reyranella sp.]|nr:AmpG family muropeptide MFS transporter [Reyranella sp.]
IGGASGAVVDAYGYPLLFTATAGIGIPLVLLCLIVRRDTMKTVEEKEEAAEMTAAPVGAGSRA